MCESTRDSNTNKDARFTGFWKSKVKSLGEHGLYSMLTSRFSSEDSTSKKETLLHQVPSTIEIIDDDEFERCPKRRLKEKIFSSDSSSSGWQSDDSWSGTDQTDDSREPIGLHDFEALRVLGKGSHGTVFLVRHRASGELYAMKQLKKHDVIKKDQVRNTLRELEVHKMLASEEELSNYCAKLRYAFHSKHRLYMVFDFCSGGELYFHIGRRGRLPEVLARQFAAEIAWTLGQLHRRGIMYRDLKPENLMLDPNGHIKMVDFGLCVNNITSNLKSCHTFSGTTEYLAPEILNYKEHGLVIDWWAFGMVLFEMLTGLPPWYSFNQDEVVQGVKYSALKIPEYLSANAADLVQKLLEKNPERRMGAKSDFEEIAQHPFFSDIDWENVATCSLKSIFVPPSSEVTCNFDSEFTAAQVRVESDWQPSPRGDVFSGFYHDSEDPACSSSWEM